MASSINADNGVISGSSGLKSTADASGVLALQTNGTTAVSIDSSQAVTIQGLTVGKGAGSVATNTAVGSAALFTNTTGAYNQAFGPSALNLNTTGGYNVAVGNALASNTTGNGNAAVGNGALTANTTGSENTAIGSAYNTYAPLRYNTTGNYNTAVGSGALVNNTTASNNTAVGYQAGYSNTAGANNTIVGYQAGYSATSNGVSTFVGAAAGYSATNSIGNTFIGQNAGYSVTTGVQNTFVGHQTDGYAAGYYVTTGSKNTILGGYTGNNGGLDIRTASNYIVLSDGDGNARHTVNNSGAHAFDLAGSSFGTSGQVLTSAGSSAVPTWSTLAGSPLVLISTVTASGATYVTFDNTVITSAYDEYIVQFVGNSSGSYASLLYQLYGTSAWLTAGYNFWNNNGAAVYTATSATEVLFGGATQGNNQPYLAAANTYMMEVRLYRVNDTGGVKNKLCTHTGSYSNGNNWAVQTIGGCYQLNMTSQPVRGIRFYTSSPTMTGFARLYGVKNS